MPQTRANQNETIDAIAFRIFGKSSPLVEQIMKLNPNLAGLIFIPEGTIINIPSPNEIDPAKPKITNLWD